MTPQDHSDEFTDRPEQDGPLDVTGAAITGKGGARVTYLMLGGSWITAHDVRSTQWKTVTPEPQPLGQMFPEVSRRLPFAAKKASVPLMFHQSTLSEKTIPRAGEWLFFGYTPEPGTSRHIGCNLGTRQVTEETPAWWRSGEETVVGAAVMPDGSTLYSTRGKVWITTGHGGDRRSIGETPTGTTAICYDATVGVVYFFTSPTEVAIGKLTGAGHSTYALATPTTQKIDTIWPDHPQF